MCRYPVLATLKRDESFGWVLPLLADDPLADADTGNGILVMGQLRCV